RVTKGFEADLSSVSLGERIPVHESAEPPYGDDVARILDVVSRVPSHHEHVVAGTGCDSATVAQTEGRGGHRGCRPKGLSGRQSSVYQQLKLPVQARPVGRPRVRRVRACQDGHSDRLEDRDSRTW